VAAVGTGLPGRPAAAQSGVRLGARLQQQSQGGGRRATDAALPVVEPAQRREKRRLVHRRSIQPIECRRRS